MWPSEAAASKLYDAANIMLIGALVLGVIATGLVVWMGNVKEEYLRRQLAAAGERAGKAEEAAGDANERAGKAQAGNLRLGIDLAKAKTETEKREAELAREQRRAAEAQEAAAKAQLEVKQLADMTFRRTIMRAMSIDGSKFLDKLKGVPPSRVEILYKPDDDEAYMLGITLAGLLRKSGWEAAEPRPVTLADDLRVPESSWENKLENVPLTMRAGGGINGVAVIVRGPLENPPPFFFDKPLKATGGYAVLFALQWSGVAASTITQSPQMPAGTVRLVIGSANN